MLRVEDAVCGVGDGGGEDGGFGAEEEPGLLPGDVADELGVVFAAGAHEAGADGGDADALGAELGVEAFGEAGEGELRGGIGEQVGDGHLAADRRDIDDGGAVRGAGVKRALGEEARQGGEGGVEGGEEVGLHDVFEGGDGLVFDGADLE